MVCIYFIVFGYLFLCILLLYGLVSFYDLILSLLFSVGGHGGRVVTLSPPTYEAGLRSP